MLRRSIVLTGLITLLAAGSVFAQEGRRQFRGFGGFGGGGFGGGGGAAFLLGMPELQKELSVSDEQKGLIDDMLADLREQFQPRGNLQDFQNLSEEERRQRGEEMRKRFEEIGKKTDEMIGMILDEKQTTRFNELKLQREGVGALSRDEVAKKLGLSEEQRNKIRKIQEDARPDPSQFANFQNMSEDERREAFTKMRERGEKANADILNVLSGEQKEQWTKMQGKKFDFPQGGGFGGRRPGGEQGGETQRRRPETNKTDQ